MNFKKLGIQAAVPLTAMGLVAAIAPSAEAVVFRTGDTLSGNASFQIIGDANTSRNIDFLNASDASGAGGSFGVNNSSTGGFVPYINSGATDNPFYKIRDIDLTGITTLTNFTDFLKFDDGAGNLDEWAMDLVNVVISEELSPTARRIIIDGDVLFRSSNSAPGGGGFTATQGKLRSAVTYRGAGSASFDYTVSVPEPLTLLATGTALGFGLLFQRQRSKQQQDAAKA